MDGCGANLQSLPWALRRLDHLHQKPIHERPLFPTLKLVSAFWKSAADLHRDTSPRHSRRQSEMACRLAPVVRDFGAQTYCQGNRIYFEGKAKKEPPRFLRGPARRSPTVSYSSRQLDKEIHRANYRGLVILTKPMIAQHAPRTTNKLKKAPTPKAEVRSTEF